jgi:hypothetical protein
LFSYLAEIKRPNVYSLELSEGPKHKLVTIVKPIDLSYKKLRTPGDVLATGAAASLNLSLNKIQK